MGFSVVVVLCRYIVEYAFDLTLFEALTGGAFDRQNGNIAGNLTKIFQKSQMPRGLPGGGMGGFGFDRYIRSV